MDVSKLYERAEDAIKRKNFDYAIEVLKNQILSIYPDDVKARRLLRGCVNKKLNENGHPSASAKQIAGLMPSIKITMFKMMKKWEKVMEECENYLLNDPRNVKMIATLGSAAAQAGYLDTAISQYESCLEVDNKHCPALRALGYLYEKKEELVKAIEFFKKACHYDQTDGESKRKLKDLSARITAQDYSGAKHSRDLLKDDEEERSLAVDEKILRSKEDYLEAIEVTKKNLLQEPDRGKVHNRRLGQLYQGIEDYKSALVHFEKAFELDPTSFDTSVQIGECKIRQMDAKVRKYRVKAKEGDTEAKKKYKAHSTKLNDFKVSEYTRRVTEHPTDLEQRFRLGAVLMQVGKSEDAIGHLQKSTKNPRFKMQSFSLLGKAFMENDEPGLAVKQFEKALEDIHRTDDRSKQLRYDLAGALVTWGDPDRALELYTEIMEDDINFKDVKKKVKEARAAKKGD